jgi:hypothetical protein
LSDMFSRVRMSALVPHITHFGFTESKMTISFNRHLSIAWVTCEKENVPMDSFYIADATAILCLLSDSTLWLSFGAHHH